MVAPSIGIRETCPPGGKPPHHSNDESTSWRCVPTKAPQLLCALRSLSSGSLREDVSIAVRSVTVKIDMAPFSGLL